MQSTRSDKPARAALQPSSPTKIREGLESQFQRLWHALPSVAARLEPNQDPTESVAPSASEADNDTMQTRAAGQHGSVSVSWAEMRQLVHCLYCAIHGNPTPGDADAAVDAVIGSAESMHQPSYSRPDVFTFLDAIPSIWLSRETQAALRSLPKSAPKLLAFYTEMVGCVTDDEAPHALLEPQNVLMMRPAPAMLSTPLEQFIKLTAPLSYAPVYDVLWEHLQEGQEVPTLSQSQFRMFFTWFYLLRFSNATASRAEAAADAVWRRFLDARGAFTMTSFQRACNFMCCRYTQQRDTAKVLQNYTDATVRRREKQHLDSNGILFFSECGTDDASADSVAQAELQDPTDLYVSSELRPWRHEADVHRDSQTSRNRVLLLGLPCVGKTTAGRALAAALNCVHLDVLELAMAAMQRAASDDDLAQQLTTFVESQSPIPLALQAALIRQALVRQATAYRGYVLSDAIPLTSASADVAVRFLEECGALTELLPTVLVELTCDPEVQAQREELVEAQRHETYRATVEKQADARALHLRDEEKTKMRGDCDRLIAHLLEVERDAQATEEELAVARQQAMEAQAILDALNKEEGAEVPLDDGTTAETADVNASPGSDGAADAAQDATYDLKVLLRHLITRGRADALPADVSSPDRTAGPQPSGLPQAKRLMESLFLQEHIIRVDGTSTTSDLVQYVVSTSGMQPCVLAQEPHLAEDADAPEGTARSDDELGQRKLAAALAEGNEPSPWWKRYCPVTFVEDGVLVEGGEAYCVTFRSRLYFMASAAKMHRFMDSPSNYLLHRPVDRQPVLLLRGAADTAAWQRTELDVELLAARVAERLQLTKTSFSDYSESWKQQQALQAKRDAILVRRQAADAKAWEAREERKRRREELEAKLRRKAGVKKPKVKHTESAGRDTSTAAKDFDEKRWSETSPAATLSPLEAALAQKIKECQVQRQTDVPVLVLALHEEDVQAAAFERLWKKQELPRTVVVLECTAPAEADSHSLNDSAESSRATEKDWAAVANANEAEPFSTSTAVRRLQEVAAAAGAGGDDKPAAGALVLQTVNVFSKSVEEVLLEVEQFVNPAAALATEGEVDEELGEFVMEGDEEEEAEEDEEDEALVEMTGGGGDGEAAGLPPGRQRQLSDPLVRPGKRFLNQFGCSLEYCPVTLREKGTLVQGRREFCLQYWGALYCFASEEYLHRFQRNPLLYVDDESMPCVPPRLWVVGTNLSGKRTLAAGLSKQFHLPFFVYDRAFLERCLECMQRHPHGGEVSGIHIPPQSRDNPYLDRALNILQVMRDFAAEQERCLKLRSEAEAVMAERERREEEAEEQELAASSQYDASETALDEEEEERLRTNLEFEPEEEEDRQIRLSESYLRIAGCITRVEPFQSSGYIMICPLFSEGDLDILFSEDAVPEVVVHTAVSAETFATRAANVNKSRAAGKQQQQQAKDALHEPDVARQADEASARAERRRERSVQRWRRRHLSDSPASDSEDDGREQDKLNTETMDNSASIKREADDEVLVEGDAATWAMQEEAVAEFVEGLTERSVKMVRVTTDLAPGAVLHITNAQLSRHLENRQSLLHAAQAVSFAEAEVMLKMGAANLCCFGQEDPVQLYDARHGVRRVCWWKPPGEGVAAEQAENQPEVDQGESRLSFSMAGDSPAAEPMDGAAPGAGDLTSRAAAKSIGDEEAEEEDEEEHSEADPQEVEERRRKREQKLAKLQAPRAALFRHRIYFFRSDSELLRFLHNPIQFVQQPPPPPRLLQQPVVSIFDATDACSLTDPHSGVKQRMLGESVGYNLGYVTISVGKLLAWAAVHPLLGSLSARALQAAVTRTVKEDLVQQLFCIRLSCADVKVRGAVLLNLPQTIAQVGAVCDGRAGCSPVVKVNPTVLGLSPGAAPPASMSAVMQHMQQYALVLLPVPYPETPKISANLLEVVRYLDEFVAHERDARLRQLNAFPAALANTYHTRAAIRNHLSEYRWYCPYSWVMEGVLENLSVESTLPAYGACYLGKYYFFRSRDYLHRFLRFPSELADPANLKPLPPQLPQHVPHHALSPDAYFELKGCCPVTLYDTRERRGLRGVLEPIAVRGSPDCCVCYGDQYYLMADTSAMHRFLQRPWLYTKHSFLPSPHKCPLSESDASADLADEEYVHRHLYDPVARAMLAVARVKPKYPGLSIEESAMKYVALHLKANNAANGAVQARQYKANLDLFERRATLYRTMTEASTESSGTEVDVNELCLELERMQEDTIPIEALASVQVEHPNSRGNSAQL